METTSKIQEKRKALIELSVQARAFKEEQLNNATTESEQMYWAGIGINAILINHFYKKNGESEFNRFHEWKKQGATIKKGEKAFIIWGQPRKATKIHEIENQDPTEEEYKLWPLCFLFSDKQVFKPGLEQTETAQAQIQEPSKAPFELD
jgi:hypothetical protein